MQCLICGKDSAGEVCNQCIRAEQGIYAKDWTYKEGLIVKKTEDLKVVVSFSKLRNSDRKHLNSVQVLCVFWMEKIHWMQRAFIRRLMMQPMHY